MRPSTVQTLAFSLYRGQRQSIELPSPPVFALQRLHTRIAAPTPTSKAVHLTAYDQCRRTSDQQLHIYTLLADAPSPAVHARRDTLLRYRLTDAMTPRAVGH